MIAAADRYVKGVANFLMFKMMTDNAKPAIIMLGIQMSWKTWPEFG